MKNIRKLNEQLAVLTHINTAAPLNEIYGDYAYDVKINDEFITGADLFYVESYEDRPFTQKNKAYLPKAEYYKVGITANKDNKGNNIPIYIAEGAMDLQGEWIYFPTVTEEVYNIKDSEIKTYIINKFIEFTKGYGMDELTKTIKDRIA